MDKTFNSDFYHGRVSLGSEERWVWETTPTPPSVRNISLVLTPLIFLMLFLYFLLYFISEMFLFCPHLNSMQSNKEVLSPKAYVVWKYRPLLYS